MNKAKSKQQKVDKKQKKKAVKVEKTENKDKIIIWKKFSTPGQKKKKYGLISLRRILQRKRKQRVTNQKLVIP